MKAPSSRTSSRTPSPAPSSPSPSPRPSLRTLAPALPLALGLLGGLTLAAGLARISLPLAVALFAAGVALGRRRGAAIACLALGLLLPEVRGEARPRPGEMPDLSRPVEAVVEVVGPWRLHPRTRSAPVEIRTLVQGREVFFQPRRAWLSLPEPEGGREEGAEVSAGTRLRVRGHLGRSEGAWNRRPAEPGPFRLAVKSERLVRPEGEAGALPRLGDRLRRRVTEAWAEVRSRRGEDPREASGPGLALARSLLLGDRRDLPEPWLRGLRRGGLAHLLAVSGLHVGLLAGLVLFLPGAWPRGLRLGLVVLVVALYLLLVGPTPSLVRASVMTVLAVGALALERPPAAVNALAWAVIFLLLQQPSLVTDVGFQLTAAATAGLVLGTRPLVESWTRLPPWLGRPLAASVAAQLSSLPFALPRFHLLAPLAPLANLFFVPWTALALVGSLAWTLLALVAPTLAASTLPALDLLAAPFAAPAAVTRGVDLAVPLALPAGVGGTLLPALLAAGLYRLLLSPRWLLLAGLVLGLPLGLLLLAPPVLAPPVLASSPVASTPELVMLDVGQGDALLLRDGARAVLVDGGGWEGGDFAGRVLLPALLGEGVRRLDAVVLTHPDLDHCGGLAGIVDYLPVGEVWTAPGLPKTGCGGELILRPGLPQRVLWQGRKVAVGAWEIDVLHPAAGERREGNGGSLVLLAAVHGRRVLLTGDIDAPTERRLLRLFPRAFPVDVLKVAHHGSKSSSSGTFLRRAAPVLAIVSAGRRNRYHHPAAEVVGRFAGRGIPLLRTDVDGAIRVAFPPGGGLRVGVEGPPWEGWP